jgi:hypothetical protein
MASFDNADNADNAANAANASFEAFGDPLEAIAGELVGGAMAAVEAAIPHLDGVTVSHAPGRRPEIRVGDDHKVELGTYPGEEDVLQLSVFEHDEPVQNNALDARGYVSGRKDVHVPIDFAELLEELRFLRDLFTQENS